MGSAVKYQRTLFEPEHGLFRESYRTFLDRHVAPYHDDVVAFGAIHTLAEHGVEDRVDQRRGLALFAHHLGVGLGNLLLLRFLIHWTHLHHAIRTNRSLTR